MFGTQFIKCCKDLLIKIKFILKSIRPNQRNAANWRVCCKSCDESKLENIVAMTLATCASGSAQYGRPGCDLKQINAL